MPSETTAARTHQGGLLAVFFVLVLLSIALTSTVSGMHNRFMKDRLDEVAQALVYQIHSRMQLYSYGLQQTRIAVLSGGGRYISRYRMKEFGKLLDIKNDYPGSRGFGFVRKVEPENVRFMISVLQNQGLKEVRFYQFTPHDGTRYILHSIQPEDAFQNKHAIGLDLASEPRRKAALDKAMLTGTIQLTEPIALLSNTNVTSFLMLLPIYEDGVTPKTEQGRIDKLIGWANAPLNVPEVMAQLNINRQKIHYDLTDITQANQHLSFFAQHENDQHRYSVTKQLDVFGRIWELHISPTQLFMDEMHLVPLYVIFAISLIASVLITLLMGQFLSSRRNQNRFIQEQIKLQAIVESSADAIIGKSLDGKIISWNSGAANIFGYTREQALGHLLSDLVFPKRLVHEELETIQKVRSGETVSNFESIRHRADGTEFFVSETASPVRGANGQIVGIAKTVRDISARKAAQEEIKQLNSNLEELVTQRTEELADVNALLSSVLNSASEISVIATDTEGNVTLFNAGAEKMLGYSSEEVIGKLSPAIFHDPNEVDEYGRVLSERYNHQVEGFQVFIEECLHNNAESLEWTYIDKSGRRFPVNLLVTNIHDDQHQIIGYLGIAINITEQRAAQDALLLAKEEADAAKSRFLANMSHEIRTPMNAVLGMLQLLLKTELNPKQHDFTEKAKIAATSLLSLLNDILDYSKIESGKLELAPHPFNFYEFLEHISVVVSGNIKDKPIELLYDIDHRIPSMLIGDDLRLQQVFINLLSNAIKFTNHGSVVVRSQLLSSDSTQLKLRICIEDTGIGMTPDQIEHIFESFTQAEASISRKYGGTGLGLVITKHLVELMGGCIEVESEKDVGSRFSFELTLDMPEQQASELAPLAQAIKVLVVDDNPIALALLSENLALLSTDVHVASDGHDALQQYRAAFKAGHPFDLVMTDWVMPNIDGAQLIRLMKQAAPEQTCRFMLITAANQSDIPSATDQLPYEAVLTKPITPRQLANAVKTKRDHTLTTDTTEALTGQLEGLTLLLVEDNAFNQTVAVELLKGEGARVITANDGREGIEKLHAHAKQIALVLMDMQMPHMDGLTATRIIRENSQYDDLPIIAMTANVSTDDRTACKEAGMNDFLAKPLNFDDVISVIARFTHTKAKTSVVKPANMPTHSDSPLDDILQRFNGNLRTYRKILQQLPASFDLLLKEFTQGIKANELDQVLRALHTLKGCSGTAGLQQSYQLIVQHEAALKHTRTLDKQMLDTLYLSLKNVSQMEYAALKAQVDEALSEVTPGAIALSADYERQTELLTHLFQMLTTRNLDALSLIEEIDQYQWPDPELIIQLKQSVETLQFDKALSLIESLKESLS